MRVTHLCALALLLVGCADKDLRATAQQKVQAAIARKFGPKATIVSEVMRGSKNDPVICGYVSDFGATYATDGFIWTFNSFETAGWKDTDHTRFDRKTKDICGPDWVMPLRSVRSVS
jgi:hypothetical protein